MPDASASPVILAADTSSSVTVVALAAGGAAREGAVHWRTTHGQDFFRLVAGLLDDAGMVPADVDAWALGSGPGSFTGLRLSFGAFRAFAHAHGKPVIHVDSFAALARPFRGLAGTLAVVQQARRGRVYLACPLRDGDVDCLPTEAAAARLGAAAGPVFLLGSAAAELAAAGAGNVLAERPAPLGLDLLETALEAWQRGDRLAWYDAVPRYVQASEAEEQAGAA